MPYKCKHISQTDLRECPDGVVLCSLEKSAHLEEGNASVVPLATPFNCSISDIVLPVELVLFAEPHLQCDAIVILPSVQYEQAEVC